MKIALTPFSDSNPGAACVAGGFSHASGTVMGSGLTASAPSAGEQTHNSAISGMRGKFMAGRLPADARKVGPRLDPLFSVRAYAGGGSRGAAAAGDSAACGPAPRGRAPHPALSPE